MKKKYISKEANPLSIDILIGGTLRSFDFAGGMKSPVVKLPTFSTSVIEEQKALEAYPGFGTSFDLVQSVFVDTTENVIDEIADETPVDESQNTDESQFEQTDEKADPEKNKTFKNGAACKDWLNKEMGIPVARLTNKANMILEAGILGYTIEFETT